MIKIKKLDLKTILYSNPHSVLRLCQFPQYDVYFQASDPNVRSHVAFSFPLIWKVLSQLFLDYPPVAFGNLHSIGISS